MRPFPVLPYKNWNNKKKINITHRSTSRNINKFVHLQQEKMREQILFKERNNTLVHLPIVTNRNYVNEVLNPDKSIVLFYYADHCVFCKKISTILSTIKTNHPKYNIQKINYVNDPIHPPNKTITHVPTVLLLQKNNKKQPILFNQSYTLDNYMQFIKNHWI
jgi:thiol-disulfide isomerase/thioredoxin